MHTHDLEIGAETVVKRFRSWELGQPEREWRALRLLAEHAPGLAPRPVRADLDGDPPVVVMSRVGGVPLEPPIPPDRLAALADALATAYEAIPRSRLAAVPPRPGRFAEMAGLVRSRCDRRPRLGSDSLVRRAFAEGVRWLATVRPDGTPDGRTDETAHPVFGLGDGNLGNYLWDGSRVRIIDFEFSGRGDRAHELAEAVEHLSTWAHGGSGISELLPCFDLGRAETARLRDSRRLLALYWLLVLLPGSPGRARNPPGTPARQAARLLALLDA